MRIFTIYDRKAEGHKPPFSIRTIGEAERSFLDACQNDDTDLGKHAEDYQLWQVAKFDEFSGEVTPEKLHICNGQNATPFNGPDLEVAK